MSRRLGPKHTLCRRLGVKICTSDKCPVVRRSYPAGVHGPKGKRRLTEYATQLLEKQKAKTIYGVLERQFKRYYQIAMKRKGDTSVYLTELLERRLDNMIYRFGLAKTRSQARQMVVHGHVRVNGRKVDRPSYSVREGDAVTMKETPKTVEKRPELSWVLFDEKTSTGKMTSAPNVTELPEQINTRLIIEFYSR